MTKIAFIGAGSTIFAKNVLGDCLMVPAVNGFEFALYDIDPKRLKESKDMLEHLKTAIMTRYRSAPMTTERKLWRERNT